MNILRLARLIELTRENDRLCRDNAELERRYTAALAALRRELLDELRPGQTINAVVVLDGKRE